MTDAANGMFDDESIEGHRAKFPLIQTTLLQRFKRYIARVIQNMDEIEARENAMEQSCAELKPLSAVTLKPNDVVILTCPGSMSHDEYECTSESLKADFPNNTVRILQRGTTLSVISKEDDNG